MVGSRRIQRHRHQDRADETQWTIAPLVQIDIKIWPPQHWPAIVKEGVTMDFGITFKGVVRPERARALVRQAENAGFSYCWFYGACCTISRPGSIDGAVIA
jgi:hypothetical protein